jgi:arylsulfatase A-like enzyme
MTDSPERRGSLSGVAFGLGLLAFLLVLPGCSRESEGRPQAGRVNLVILLMDTTRRDHCSLPGSSRSCTPEIAKLAAEGTTFTGAWSPSSWTAPSHASLFTGLLPRHHGLWMGNRVYLDDEAETLAEILCERGYRTACWTDNHLISPQWGLAQGFERWEPVYQRGPARESRCWQSLGEALTWCRETHRRRERFFLFVNLMEPHLPYAPPRRYRKGFLPEGIDSTIVERASRIQSPKHLAYCLGKLELPDETLQALRGLYAAEIATVDDAIGVFLEGLRQEGILDETLVVVTADHGEALGEHHMLGHNLSLASWLVRVPLVLRLPGRFEGGNAVEDVVRLEDLFPTLLEICGAPVPEGLDGRSILRDLPGRVHRGVLGRPRFEDFQKLLGPVESKEFDVSIDSVSDGRYLFLKYSDGREELFDLDEDPGQLENLLPERASVVEELRRHLAGR